MNPIKWFKKLPRKQKYLLFKMTSIFLGTLSVPLCTFIGYKMGAGAGFLTLVVWGYMSFSMLLYVIDSAIWWWLIENVDAIRQKVRKRKKKK